jgi:pimeloyl-ACP methyl ester carboxylesterase
MNDSTRGLLVLGVGLLVVITGCGGGGSSITQIFVSISPSSATVQVGGSQQFTASIQNDPANKGVTWAISPASGAGTLSNSTSTSVTYNPPASAPATAVSVTITATSVADPTKSAAGAITLPGAPSGSLTVTVTPPTASLQPGMTLQVTATVTNDPTSAGVTWSVSCATALPGAYVNAPCGTVSSAATPSGTPTTYTAPGFGDLTVTLTATSVSGNAVASATISVPGIAILISPASVTVPVGATQQFTATVVNDSSNQGVTWTLTYLQNGGLIPCLSAEVCGTVSPTSTPSGAVTTYTAPASPAAGDLEVDIVATSVANNAVSTEGVQGFITIPGIKVSITPSTTDVEAGATAPFTATVTDDPSKNGVIWTVSCSATSCGSVSPTGTASGTATTYTAPSTPPSGDLAVTIAATSVTNSGASASATANVKAIQVSVTPPSALLPPSTSLQITPTVTYDPNNQGVSWALTQNGIACAPTCGSVAPSSTPSGSPATYTVPANLPSNPAVTITAASLTSPANTAAVAITLTAGSVQIVPYSMDFGRVLTHTTSSAQATTLTNTGSAAINISGVTISGTHPGDFAQTNNCNSSVGAGAFCSISVTFTPTTIGTRTATLSVADSSTDSPQQVTLTGVGYTKQTRATAAVHSNLASSRQIAIPAPTGRNAVGTRVVYLTDATRIDPYVAGRAERELAVRFWYPASLRRECRTAEYTSPAVWNYFAQLVNAGTFQVTTNSCVNAPVAYGKHPVVVFTPGYTATFTDYTFLFEDLASRGYIVASVAHTYETTAVELADGKLAKSVLGSHLDNTWRGDERTFTLATVVRLQDLQFILNELGRLNAQTGSPFNGQLDLSEVAIAGHSMGGSTALLEAQLDQRFKVVIMLDAAIPEALTSTTQTPVLILAAGRIQWDAGECRLWNGLKGPRVAVNLRGSEHVAFSDWIWLAKNAVETGPMGPEKTMSAVREYVAAFLDANLRHELPSALLSGTSPDYTGAVLITREQSLCGLP